MSARKERIIKGKVIIPCERCGEDIEVELHPFEDGSYYRVTVTKEGITIEMRTYSISCPHCNLIGSIL